MSYTPNAGTIAHNILSFFAYNPEKILTLDDIVIKFFNSATSTQTRSSIHTLLGPSVLHEFLCRTRNVEEEYVYTIGKRLVHNMQNGEFLPAVQFMPIKDVGAQYWDAPKTTMQVPEPKKSIATKDTSKPKTKPRDPFCEEIVKTRHNTTKGQKFRPVPTDVTVETDVPIPPARRGGFEKWGPFLEKLTAVGQSIQLDDRDAHCIKTFIYNRRKKKLDSGPTYRVGNDGNGKKRVWRTA